MISLIRVTANNFDRFAQEILAIEKVSFPSPWTLDAFREEVQRSFSSLWVLLDQDELVGYLCFWSMAGELHLMNIAVHPRRRGEGLGGMLLEKMITTGISDGADCALLEVRPSNRRARELYKNVGFREIGRRTRYYRDTGEDAILMALQLNVAGNAGAWPAVHTSP
ncbi:MAG: ribosomal protein S18-alanine N-acetyltransferase [Deltaproteobacteria bacterium]|nr:ribosomal protein S18-alanine N-acetyltransferase [Deltaproteobacteria bacterium]